MPEFTINTAVEMADTDNLVPSEKLPEGFRDEATRALLLERMEVGRRAFDALKIDHERWFVDDRKALTWKLDVDYPHDLEGNMAVQRGSAGPWDAEYHDRELVGRLFFRAGTSFLEDMDMDSVDGDYIAKVRPEFIEQEQSHWIEAEGASLRAVLESTSTSNVPVARSPRARL